MSRGTVPEPTLYLVGLGPGPVELATLGAWELLASGKPLRLKDPNHETAQTALSRGISFEPAVASDPESFADDVLEWALRMGTGVYAVPGNALDAPETQSILDKAGERGVAVKIVPGLSDVEAIPAADPITRSHVSGEALRAGLAFQRLVSVMGRLRSPNGCPWDREQTHSTLAVHLLEETYEALDAIDRTDMQDLKEELGDLLLQVVFHSELARENGDFEPAEVVEKLIGKLVYRHPHIFGDVVVGGAEDVVVNWEQLKREEKGRGSVHEGIPRELPALLYAYKVQRRLARQGAGPQVSHEEVAKLARLAVRDRSEAVFGDLLYAVVDLARTAGVDPEGALRRRASATGVQAG